ncbi:MAG: phage integrase central domain-containing protein [Bifidobacterium sp.]
MAAHESVWKPSHHHSIETAWRVHVKPKWGERQLSKITHSEVQDWVNELAKARSATVVIRAFGILKGIYDTAVKDGRIVRAPVTDIQLPKKAASRANTSRRGNYWPLRMLAAHTGR